MEIFFTERLNDRDFVLSESFDCFDGFGHGAFQKRLFLICIISIFAASSHSYITSLITGDVDHWCRQPPHTNMSAIAWKTEGIPLEADGQLSKCRRYDDPEDHNHSRIVPCEEWEYDDDQAMTTMRSKWNLVCDRQALFKAAVLSERVASVVFGVTAGFLSDWLGRIPIMHMAVVLLLASTVSSCFASTYELYVAFRFLAQGGAIATYLITGILFFEVTTHKNRPIHVVISGAAASVLSESWIVIMTQARLAWEIKQAVFVAPTLLLITTFSIHLESPRWLISKSRLKGAEDVMLEAAEINNFPLQNTACLIRELQDEAAKAPRKVALTEAQAPLLSGASVRKHALATFALYFSLGYALRAVNLLTEMRNEPRVKQAAFAVNLLCFPAMIHLLRTVTMRQFITACFFLLGVLMCLLSILIAFEASVASDAFLALAKALSTPANIVFTTYTLELFPTGVRGTASGWVFGFGATGSLFAAASLTLRKDARKAATLASAATFLFASVLAQRALPRNTTAECAMLSSRRSSAAHQKVLKHMMRSLETPAQRQGRTDVLEDF
ncbi:hypothetical protein HPB48_021045 [Haemaphysalis longicornis]|uniref:Uncharacterized protein n=1 Tax=Haemaphysalis longicornis TaxID=44386 RepID=A0A9J6G9K9_HAELO|nr:hypothetical protein HPB48_021045 [Haemaphysalis longicornis]